MTRGLYRAKPAPGSFADLILQYRTFKSHEWAPGTRRMYDKILGTFLDLNGQHMVVDMRRGDFVSMRNSMAATPSMANLWAAVIQPMIAYAVEIEMIPVNPLGRVKRLSVPNKDGYRTWRDDEINAFVAHWPIGSLPRLALTLALCTGAARTDLVALGWANVQGSRIRYRRLKTGAAVDIPILPPLEQALTHLPLGKMTFLETKDGRVRSAAALTGDFHRWVGLAGLGGKDASGHHLSLHGLRKAGARRAAEAGADAFQLMAWFGWSDIGMAQHYAKAYSRSRAADGMAEKLAGAKPTNVTRMRKKETKDV